jgi:hypothetical protein
MRTVVAALGATSAAEARTRFLVLAHALGLRNTIESDMSPDLIADQLVATVNAERLANNPVRFSPGDLRSLVIDSLTEQAP